MHAIFRTGIPLSVERWAFKKRQREGAQGTLLLHIRLLAMLSGFEVGVLEKAGWWWWANTHPEQYPGSEPVWARGVRHQEGCGPIFVMVDLWTLFGRVLYSSED